MRHTLPSLPYDHAALEPHIDARTMMLHHDVHHKSYVQNLNTVLEKYPELQERTATWLLRNRGKVPEAARRFALTSGPVAGELDDEAGLAVATMV